LLVASLAVPKLLASFFDWADLQVPAQMRPGSESGAGRMSGGGHRLLVFG
jgi:hypothetical protein